MLFNGNFPFELYFSCSTGVMLSVLIPIFRRNLPLPEGSTAGASSIFVSIWRIARPYVMLGLFSLSTSLLLVAMLEPSIDNWRVALLIGYSWDSTLQKLKVN